MRRGLNPNRAQKWETTGGVSCFVAGILAALLGSVLTASGWILGADLHPLVHAAGTVLLIVTIPLILFAGFCLDWAERSPSKPNNDDRHPGKGKASPEPVMVSKKIKRDVGEAGVTQSKKEVSLDKLLKTHGEHAGSNISKHIKQVV